LTLGRRKGISGELPATFLWVSISVAKDTLEQEFSMIIQIITTKISGNTIQMLTYGRRKRILGELPADLLLVSA